MLLILDIIRQDPTGYRWGSYYFDVRWRSFMVLGTKVAPFP